MYIPKHYRIEDQVKLLAFMRANSFATLVSSQAEALLASHLPFVIVSSASRGAITLLGHMARANPQWKTFAEGREVMVIFQGPHAYISPAFYSSKVNVPTWNYAAVHAYGMPHILSGDSVEAVITSVIDSFQPSYRSQYDDLPADYKRNMLNGIVAFEIPVTRLEGKRKLSQNKTLGEQRRIADTLVADHDQVTAGVGRLMQENLRDEAGRSVIGLERRLP